jgi:hypothetical protein
VLYIITTISFNEKEKTFVYYLLQWRHKHTLAGSTDDILNPTIPIGKSTISNESVFGSQDDISPSLFLLITDISSRNLPSSGAHTSSPHSRLGSTSWYREGHSQTKGLQMKWGTEKTIWPSCGKRDWGGFEVGGRRETRTRGH